MAMLAKNSFRPLSWGLSFNIRWFHGKCRKDNVFVPFLGDFLSITAEKPIKVGENEFSSPFLGTFFQYGVASKEIGW